MKIYQGDNYHLGEINEHFHDWSRNCQVDPIYHTPGQYNPADLSTRGLAKADQVIFGSEWQDGPDYLRCERETWPISRATNLVLFLAMKETYYAAQDNKWTDLAPYRVTDQKNIAHQVLWVT